jgi:hypothetical protein
MRVFSGVVEQRKSSRDVTGHLQQLRGPDPGLGRSDNVSVMSEPRRRDGDVKTCI